MPWVPAVGTAEGDTVLGAGPRFHWASKDGAVQECGRGNPGRGSGCYVDWGMDCLGEGVPSALGQSSSSPVRVRMHILSAPSRPRETEALAAGPRATVLQAKASALLPQVHAYIISYLLANWMSAYVPYTTLELSFPTQELHGVI